MLILGIHKSEILCLQCGWHEYVHSLHINNCARNYRHSFRENKPKTRVFYDLIRAFWACFHKNAGL